jgi:hypothetical protein
MNGQKVRILFAGSAVGGILVLLYLFHPAKTAIFLPCPIRVVTGYHCPGCGSLRAIHYLLHGNVATAMSLNPLMVLSIPVVGAMFLKPAWFSKRWVLWILLGIIISYGLLRNIPVSPFTWLAPH